MDGHGVPGYLNNGTALTEVLDVVNGEDPEGRLVHGVGVNYISLVHGTYFTSSLHLSVSLIPMDF